MVLLFGLSATRFVCPTSGGTVSQDRGEVKLLVLVYPLCLRPEIV